MESVTNKAILCIATWRQLTGQCSARTLPRNSVLLAAAAMTLYLYHRQTDGGTDGSTDILNAPCISQVVLATPVTGKVWVIGGGHWGGVRGGGTPSRVKGSGAKPRKLGDFQYFTMKFSAKDGNYTALRGI